MLGLDLPTFVFQILNFLVLLAILARFFYRPLMNAIARRETLITARLEEAAAKLHDAEAEHEQAATARREFEAQEQTLLTNARAHASHESETALAAAKMEAAQIIQSSREAAAREAAEALRKVEAHVVETAISLAESIVDSAAGMSLNRALLERLLERWPDLEEAVQLSDAHPDRMVIEVPHAPTAEEEPLLRELVRRLRLPDEPTSALTYAVNPEIGGGCRIRAGDVVVDMSLSRMVAEMRNGTRGDNA